MEDFLSLKNKIPTIESILGYVFKNKTVLELAFVHRSFVNEHKAIHHHNERLEFLGDSVLGLLASEHLYKILPDLSEGELSHLRARLVEKPSCMKYINKLELGSYVLLGRGEKLNQGKGRESILADLFEAIIGAIYLDGGLESAKQFFFQNFFEEIDEIIKAPLHNWKAILQDYCQKKFQKPPLYEILSESGPEHRKIFHICVLLNKKQIGEGFGRSKKEAQQAAAENALKNLEL